MYIEQPNILLPVNGDIDVNTFDEFQIELLDPGQIAHWEIAVDLNFIQVIHSGTTTTAFTANLEINTYYYVRCRLEIDGSYTVWSNITTFKTNSYLLPIIQKPVILSPVTETSVEPEFIITTTDMVLIQGNTYHLSSDLEIATDLAFTNVVITTSDDVTLTTLVVNGTILSRSPDVHYYARVRYHGVGVTSPWSTPVKFNLVGLEPYIVQPEITIIANVTRSVIVNASFVSSAFVAVNYSDEHLHSDWEMSLHDNFTSIAFEAYNEDVNLRKWTVVNVAPETVYYARVRYKGTSEEYSEWSNTVKIISGKSMVLNPPIETVILSSDQLITENFKFIVSYDDTYNANDLHKSSDFELAGDFAFSNIRATKAGETISLLTYDVNVPPEIYGKPPILNYRYYSRTRHYRLKSGVSEWSNINAFIPHGQVPTPITPTILSPLDGSSNHDIRVVFTASPFGMQVGTDAPLSAIWEVANNINFTPVADTYTKPLATNGNTNELILNNLTPYDSYYIRVKFKTAHPYYGDWSNTVKITINAPSLILGKPVITPPSSLTAAIMPITLTSSPIVFTIGSGIFESSIWEISEVEDFATIKDQSIRNPAYTYSWPLTTMLEGTRYYVRVKYLSTPTGSTAWSDTLTFVTQVYEPSLVTPRIIAPVNNADGTSSTMTIMVSSLEVLHGTDDLVKIEIQIGDNDQFTNVIKNINLVVDASNVDLGETYTFRKIKLATGTTYKVRVRHKGNALGYTNWSSVVTFTTTSITHLANQIGILTRPDGSYQTQFGTAMDIKDDGSDLIISAPAGTVTLDNNYVSAGVHPGWGNFHIFNKNALGTYTYFKTTNSFSGAAGLRYGYSLSVCKGAPLSSNYKITSSEYYKMGLIVGDSLGTCSDFYLPWNGSAPTPVPFAGIVDIYDHNYLTNSSIGGYNRSNGIRAGSPATKADTEFGKTVYMLGNGKLNLISIPKENKLKIFSVTNLSYSNYITNPKNVNGSFAYYFAVSNDNSMLAVTGKANGSIINHNDSNTTGGLFLYNINAANTYNIDSHWNMPNPLILNSILTPPGLASDTLFGQKVAINKLGNKVAVTSSANVYIFSSGHLSGKWELEGAVGGLEFPSEDDYFNNIVINAAGTVIYVGSIIDAATSMVYVLKKGNTAAAGWFLDATIEPPVTTPPISNFGCSLLLTENDTRLLIGAQYTPTGGSVYIYE